MQGNLILASADQVAIDAVAARIMGFDPMRDLKYVRLATEQGLGSGELSEIDIRGEDIDRFTYRFKVGDNLASRAGDLLWFGPLKWAQKLFFHTPLVNLFVAASDTYHDKIWWPLHGKRFFATGKRKIPGVGCSIHIEYQTAASRVDPSASQVIG